MPVDFHSTRRAFAGALDMTTNEDTAEAIDLTGHSGLDVHRRYIRHLATRVREIDRGAVRNLTALARREGLSHVYVGHLPRLVRLHPDIKAAIAALPLGTPSRVISERSLRSVTKLPSEQQLVELGWLVTKTG